MHHNGVNMNNKTSPRTSPLPVNLSLPLPGRIARRAFAIAAFASLAFTTASFAQFEKTALIDESSWKDFYTTDSKLLPQDEDFRTYNIAFERVFQVGAPSNNNYTYQLSGVRIRPESEKSWVVGPYTFNQLQMYLARSGARMIDIEKVSDFGGTPEHPDLFAVMTRNTGSQAKTWYWQVGITLQGIRQYERDLNLRVIDIEILDSGYYAAIFIANTGADERNIIYGTETSQEDIEALATWPGSNYRVVHIGYEGNSGGDGGVYWNYILEETTEIAFALPVFDLTKAELESIALTENLRISMVDFNRYTGLYAGILVEQLP